MPAKIENPRKYGTAPYSVAVIHGGPGAPGEMAQVAKEMSIDCGVLEPLQEAKSIEGQIDELRSILSKNAKLPVTLIGWSWGAWLCFIFAAKHPEFVKKLILVASGPFEEKYASKIMNTRLSRLNCEERKKADSMASQLTNPDIKNKESMLTEFLQIISRTDSYNAVPHENSCLEFQPETYKLVWNEASQLRSSGKLLDFGRLIRCQVVAIHGDYDPHPYEGVIAPLSKVLTDFKFILLENCGHYPWYEKQAKAKFYETLRHEIG